MLTMLTTPIKLGIAVACLLAVAGIIAMDLKTNGSGAAAKTNPPPELVVPPVAAYPPAAPAPVPAEKVPAPEEKQPEVVPKAEPVVTEKKAPPAEADPGQLRIYTVVQGDTLYGISIKVFGTPRHYQKIYELNRDRIADPNRLQIGINLKMPEVPLAPAVGNAEPTAPKTLAAAEAR